MLEGFHALKSPAMEMFSTPLMGWTKSAPLAVCLAPNNFSIRGSTVVVWGVTWRVGVVVGVAMAVAVLGVARSRPGTGMTRCGVMFRLVFEGMGCGMGMREGGFGMGIGWVRTAGLVGVCWRSILRDNAAVRALSARALSTSSAALLRAALCVGAWFWGGVCVVAGLLRWAWS